MKHEKTKMLKRMIERARERQEKWMTVFVNSLPDPWSLKEISFIGAYSYSLTSSRKRMIVKKDSIILNELLRETPSAIARDFLKEKYKRGPIVKHVQALRVMDGLHGVPVYANPKRFDHGFYVDIKSAYWSIMKIAGWNVDYYPGKWLSAGTPPVDFPFEDHKIARNCLVSAGIPGKMLQYIPRGEFKEVTPGNQLTNMSLFCLIQDVLNSIADSAIRSGAIYVNTDGYIAPDEKTAAKIVAIIHDWGLTASVKAEGEGEVKSSGAYKVGGVESIPFAMRDNPQRVRRIHKPDYKDWLLRSFSWWAAENSALTE